MPRVRLATAGGDPPPMSGRCATAERHVCHAAKGFGLAGVDPRWDKGRDLLCATGATWPFEIILVPFKPHEGIHVWKSGHQEPISLFRIFSGNIPFTSQLLTTPNS